MGINCLITWASKCKVSGLRAQISTDFMVNLVKLQIIHLQPKEMIDQFGESGKMGHHLGAPLEAYNLQKKKEIVLAP